MSVPPVTNSASRDSGVMMTMPSGMRRILAFAEAGDVAVPAVHGDVDVVAQQLEPAVLVVDQRFERADVEHLDAASRRAPASRSRGEHRTDREERGLGLPACGGRRDDDVLAAAEHRVDCRGLDRAQRRPALCRGSSAERRDGAAVGRCVRCGRC